MSHIALTSTNSRLENRSITRPNARSRSAVMARRLSQSAGQRRRAARQATRARPDQTRRRTPQALGRREVIPASAAVISRLPSDRIKALRSCAVRAGPARAAGPTASRPPSVRRRSFSGRRAVAVLPSAPSPVLAGRTKGGAGCPPMPRLPAARSRREGRGRKPLPDGPPHPLPNPLRARPKL